VEHGFAQENGLSVELDATLLELAGSGVLVWGDWNERAAVVVELERLGGRCLGAGRAFISEGSRTFVGAAVSLWGEFVEVDRVVRFGRTTEAEPLLLRLDWLAGISSLLESAVQGPAPDVGGVVAALNGASFWELHSSSPDEAAFAIAEIRPPLRRVLALVDGFGDQHSIQVGETRVEVGMVGGRLAVSVAQPAASPQLGGSDPLHFALPARQPGSVEPSRAITLADVERGVDGRSTGVVAEQAARDAELDATLRDAARRHHVAGQATCVALEQELPAVVDLLESAGVSPVLLKGPVSAHDGPLPPSLRDYGDLDLLVRGAEMSTAVAALREVGFVRLQPALSDEFDREFAKSVTVSSPARASRPGGLQQFEVDLHRTLCPGPFGQQLPLEELFSRAVPVRINGRWYRSLCPEHRFLHACLHVTIGSPRPRVHSLRDLVLMAPRSARGVQRVLAESERWGIGAVLARAVAAAEVFSPGSLHPELVAALKRRPLTVRERAFLAAAHWRDGGYAVPAALTLLVLPDGRTRRAYISAHLKARRSARRETPS
jgi:hypothetical protein